MVGSFLAENHVKEEEEEDEESSSTPAPSLNFLNFRQLERQVGVFRPGADLDEYQNLVDQLRCLKNARSFEESAIISYVLLFSFDETIKGLNATKLFVVARAILSTF